MSPLVRLVSGFLLSSTALSLGQPSGIQTSPFDDGSPYARLPDGASGLRTPFISPQYHAADNPLSNEGAIGVFTGQIGYSIPLGTIGVRNRVQYHPVLTYNGNTRMPAGDDNLTSPDSWLGLGWSLEAPSISRNHKSTYFTWDDVFYADLGSLGKGQLVRGASGAFYLADNPYLVFAPDSATNGVFAGQVESWTVITIDGTRFVFGDRNGAESPSERIAYHTNGAVRASPFSIANAATAPIIYRWDLRYIADAEQVNRLFFDWQKTSISLGSSKSYTEQSYLHKIRALDGRGNEAERWEFFLADKPADEYVVPHASTPQLAQQPIPKKFLANIRIYHGNVEGSNYSFTYQFRGGGKYRKRLLNSLHST